jgi:5-methylcytosine-specific restriction endonuclease McrA
MKNKNHYNIGQNNPMFGKKRIKHSKLMQGKGNSNYKDGRTLEKRYCIDCGKELSYASYYKKSKRCQSCGMKFRLKNPKNHPNWQDGKSFENYPQKWTEELREQIRKRDDYTCQNCGITEEEHLIVVGRMLDVHHIDYNKQNCNKDNLITLCNNCNLRANYNRDYWKNYYEQKMEVLL